MKDRSDSIRRVLITGAAGASGRLLVQYLLKEQPQVEVHGLVRRKGRVEIPGVTLHEGDLLDTASLVHVLRKAKPDLIYHAAANPDKGFEAPSAILTNNVVGTANLFEAERLVEWDNGSALIIMVSSSEVYGDVRSEDVPIKETCPFRPMSPYGVSKVACDHLARVYDKAHDTLVIVTRAFTYLNPLRPDLFASSFARQIARIEAGLQPPVIKHGNLDSIRCMMSTRDMCRAYWAVATWGRFGEAYNLGGDVVMSVKEVLGVLMSLSRKSGITCKQDPNLLRPADVTMQIPDTTKVRTETGWKPEDNVGVLLLESLLDYYRREVAAK